MKNGIRMAFITVSLAASLPLAGMAAAKQSAGKTTVVSLGELKNQLKSLQGNITTTMDTLERLKAAARDNASLSGTTWKLGNKSKSVLGRITDLTEQIDRTIKAMPKT